MFYNTNHRLHQSFQINYFHFLLSHYQQQIPGTPNADSCDNKQIMHYMKITISEGPIFIIIFLCLLTDYQAIFQHLDEVVGSADTRDSFVCEVIKEAGKFKRKKLVQELEVWRTSLKNSKTATTPANRTSSQHTPTTNR